MPNLSILKPSWRGLSNINNLIIFGDSYSDVGYRPRTSPHPTEDQPLGVEFPGVTWSGPDASNWVGSLITEYITHGPVLVYDYAVGGDTVAGVHDQIRIGFLPEVGKRPEWAPWSPTDTLFVTWVGINDCGWPEEDVAREAVKQLFEEQELIYEAGARNFLLVDVPPVHLSPVGRAVSADGLTYRAWNTQLQESVAQFSASHPEVSIFIFSSWDTFKRVLHNPISHGFSFEDVSKRDGQIWVDHLHPTSQMHDWIARDMAEFLYAQPPHKNKEGE
ncbi:hypothetical protein IEO21_04849 [Rhodonia placenta]|uniref:Carbohydrate esterase family 16 protein n=2 Tax=Rhodonia placenta TaxID=104341 RepID=A0A1X6N9J0_9APHY|nr:carbohydrate esterase family 16 protein [Postia placenta MAD-698-R-SB12]KAF9814905.1 hypothetical protein IEO21_04849 [Postia placenta]OSX65317.1 carbohydrate esterase family 16 protein [Postia placenta MAD-698-R-SB12]